MSKCYLLIPILFLSQVYGAEFSRLTIKIPTDVTHSLESEGVDIKVSLRLRRLQKEQEKIDPQKDPAQYASLSQEIKRLQQMVTPSEQEGFK